MDLDVICEDPRWKEAGLESLAERAIEGLCQYLKIASEVIELSVLGCSDAHILQLNAEFRDKPTATNVLSWPAQDVTPPALPDTDPDGSLSLGDLALAFETCAREAAEQSKPLNDHVLHLIVHGVLHLLGYDHVCDAQAEQMEAIEVEILGNLGVSDPYSLNPRT